MGWNIMDSMLHNLIFNATNDGMIVIDPDEKIILFNKNAENISGEKSDAVIGKHILEVIPNSELPRVLKDFNG